MPDPFDKLFNDPEWQAYERRVGPDVAKQTLAQIQQKYRTKSATQVIPSNTPTAAAPSRPSTFSVKHPILPELARKAKLSDEAEGILKAGQELQDLYDKRIKPKLQSGQIGSVGQGLDYTYPTISRAMGGKLDPDVSEFITKSGQFGQMVNAYYSASSGGRGGVQQFQVITSPHIPHPPSGAVEVLGLSPESQQWDLQKQGEQIPVILDNIRLQESKRGPKNYGDTSAGIKPLDDAAAKHGVDW